MKSSRKSSRSNARSHWILAGTFTMSVVFALSSGSSIAATNPPFANPPSGKVIPTFTTVESVEDTVVGKDLRVGNSIKPKTGTTLNLDAANVNATTDLNVANNLSVTKKTILQGDVTNNGNPVTIVDPLNFNGAGTISSTGGNNPVLSLTSGAFPKSVKIQDMPFYPYDPIKKIYTIGSGMAGTNLNLNFSSIQSQGIIGDWQRKKASKSVRQTPGTDSVSITCPKGYIIVSCNNKTDDYYGFSAPGNLPGRDLLYLGSSIFDSYGNSPKCTTEYYVNKNLQKDSEGNTILVSAEALCYSPQSLDTSSKK